MKKLLLFMIAVFLFSNIAFTQTIKCRAYKSVLINNYTGEKTAFDFDFMILINDYVMELSNGTKWFFYGDIKWESKTEFYSAAYDQDNSKCRVHFKVTSKTEALIGVEYADLSFAYFTKIVSLGK